MRYQNAAEIRDDLARLKRRAFIRENISVATTLFSKALTRRSVAGVGCRVSLLVALMAWRYTLPRASKTEASVLHVRPLDSADNMSQRSHPTEAKSLCGAARNRTISTSM